MSQEEPASRPAATWRFPAALAVGYIAVSIGWIVSSDQLLFFLSEDLRTTARVQTIKGTGFVFFTGVLLFAVTYAHANRAFRLRSSLAETEKRYRRLLEEAPIAILVVRGGAIVDANRAARALLGAGARTEGQPLSRFLEPDSFVRIRDVAERVLETDGTIELAQETVIGSRGKRAEVAVCARRGPSDEPGSAQIALLDITERNRLETELRQAQKLQAVGQLAAGIAHDFNNLLTAVVGQANLARVYVADDSPAAGSLDQIEEVARQAEGVTRSLLTFCRVAPSEKSVVGLDEIVRSAMTLVRSTVPAAIAIETEIDAKGPVLVSADSTQLQQVLMNLAINARDAMPDGGRLTFTLTGPDDAPPEERFARLDVADTGAGMDPEVVGRIFEPFFTTKPPGTGTGLGLSVALGIISDHGGRMTVASEPGAGTTFSIYLPVRSEATDDTGRASEALEIAAAGMDGRTILLAEDNQHVREVTARLLRSFGYTVMAFGNGDRLCEAFERTPGRFALVMLDLDLPGRSGQECLAAIRESGHDVPVLLVTGSAEDLDDLTARDRRTFVLRKPFKSAELASAVSRALMSFVRG